MRSCLLLTTGLALLFTFCGTIAASENPRRSAHKSRQILLVITDNWDSHTGTLQRFERTKGGAWMPAGDPIAVVVGRNGLAWDARLPKMAAAEGPVKREGDGKAPAGVFGIRTAFGQAHERPADMRLRYIDLTRGKIECIDDVRSKYYNSLFSRWDVVPDWTSSEKMWSEPLYKWGAVIGYNKDGEVAEPGAGSCIFLHIWKGPDSSTSGCTAMEEAKLLDTLKWLEPDKYPIIVQLPKAEYARLKSQWRLP